MLDEGLRCWSGIKRVGQIDSEALKTLLAQ